MKYLIEGIAVESDLENFTEQDAQKYIDYVKERVAEPLKSIKVINCDDGKVDVDYLYHGQNFERIRRITGYLTGNLNTWNDAKRAEESERVKHTGKDGWFNSSGRQFRM